jgi:hypothetical protein
MKIFPRSIIGRDAGAAAARLGAALIVSALAAGTAFPCLICSDMPGEEEKRVEEMIATRGAAAIGELRQIFPCPTCPIGARIAAARAAGDLGDQESRSALSALVLALLDPDAPGPFGIMTGAGGLRVAAAASLHKLGAPAAGEAIWKGWREVSSERQEEAPRLLGEFVFPDLQEKLIEIMGTSGRDPVAFQAVVELRRIGNAAAAPAVREKIKEWRRQGEGTVTVGRMIRYAESTVRVLLSRPVPR